MSDTQLDALVIGTGFGGIYACYTLQKLGLNFKCFDNAGDVGGTWYWNKYPGAMSDTHSHLYRFSWDEEDFKTYPWSHNYLFQPEILAYLRHVVQRHDLRKYMQFNTEMVSATFEETANLWRVAMSTGQKFAVRYLITALGLLSQPVFPDIAGLDTFKGTLVHTAAWQDGIDLKNKRVALIGCGSTGVQVVTKISAEVKSLTCFMRNPQYVVPAGFKKFTHEQRQDLNNNFEGLWQTAWNSVMAFGISESKRTFQSATPEEREQVFEELWQTGNGIRFMMSGFCDITTDIEANDFAADFVRRKIRQIVKDPEKSRVLCPTQYYARRPLCGIDYYEQFNRDNVYPIDVKENPIISLTEGGILTGDGTEHEFDVIILATGFDALDGNYTRLHIEGRKNHTIQDHWSQTITSFGGMMLSGFPNMFMLLGPQSPFTNNPPAIEAQMELIKALIVQAESRRVESGAAGVVEVVDQVEKDWASKCEAAVQGSLFKETASWVFGANVPGKVYATRFFFPGMQAFRKITHGMVFERNFEGFVFT